MPLPQTKSETLFQRRLSTFPPRVSVIVPMFRERLRIEPTLRDLLARLPERGPGPFEILLIDDGSDDDTGGVCRALLDAEQHRTHPSIQSVRLLTHAANSGKGAAVRTGLANARGGLRLMMDADNAAEIDQLDRLMPLAETAEMVIGSRNTPDAEVEARASRQLTGILFKTALSILGIRLARDTQCGFKLYSDRAAALIVEHGAADGYCFDIEHLLLVRAAGGRFAEVGIRWHHVDGGQISPIRDGLRMLRAAHRIKRRLRTLGPLRLPPANPHPAAIVEPKPLEPVSRLAPTGNLG